MSSFLGYHGFPAHICASVNDEIVHGIPGNRRLRDGDIVSIDVGAILAGYHGDSAWTYGVGQISDEAAALLRDTEEALYLAVDAAMSGNRLGAIGHAVESHARRRGRGVVRNYGGHGIGRQMHEDPHVPNIGRPDRGVVLRTGLTLAIEPMLTLGGEDTRDAGGRLDGRHGGWVAGRPFRAHRRGGPGRGPGVDAAARSRVRITCSAHARGVRYPRVRP